MDESGLAELASAPTPTDACQRAADLVARQGNAIVAVLLRVRDGLRCYATSGTWRIYYSIPLTGGTVGEAFATGQTVVDHYLRARVQAYPLDPSSVLSMCVPIVGSAAQPVGVLKAEWPSTVDADRWRVAAESTAGQLGVRLSELGYTPRETLAERLVRHSLAIVAASEEAVLVPRMLRAARDISGLSTAVGILVETDGGGILRTEPGHHTELAERLGAMPSEQLRKVAELTHQYGVWYTRGNPAELPNAGPRQLVDAGARTVIAIPVVAPGIAGMPTSLAGRRSLLVLDASVRRPTATTVALLELLATQAIMSHERLRLLESLHLRAARDPLTGLGHQATFTERMATATPGRTALILIDIDAFKAINDTLGHPVGDQVLLSLVEALKRALRPDDELFRIGGDEFVAVVDVGGPAEVLGIAHRLRAAAHGSGCTVSVGGAVLAQGEGLDDAMPRADAAMYAAKRAGGDQIRLAR